MDNQLFFSVKTIGVMIYYITFNEIDVAYSSLFHTKNKLIKLTQIKRIKRETSMLDKYT